MQTASYSRKSFTVEAVRVNKSNMEEVAQWCGGVIVTQTTRESKTERFIHVDVVNPTSPRQEQAFVGDWVLKTDSMWKVYTNRAFLRSFEFDAELGEVENVFDKAEPETEEKVNHFPEFDEAPPGPGQVRSSSGAVITERVNLLDQAAGEES